MFGKILKSIVMAYALVSIPVVGSEDSVCGVCDGKVSELTLRYNGHSDATVKVVGDKDTIVFEEAVSSGDTFLLNGFDKQRTLGTKIKLYIDGKENTSIHTSCSEPILSGMKFGSFTITEGFSRNGGLLCETEEPQEPAPLESCGECDGKISTLTLQSNLDRTVLIEAYGHKGDLVFRGNVSKYTFFTLEGFDKQGTLGPKVSLYVDGILDTEIHTSCSEPLLAGMTFGSFRVKEGASRNGGAICSLEGGEPKGKLCGVVYEDRNANGLKETDENGTDGINVTVTDSQQAVYKTVTDTVGGYCIEELSAGDAIVEVNTSTLPIGTALTSGENPNTITVAANFTNNAGGDGYSYIKPEAFDANLTTDEDTALPITLQAEDIAGRSLTYTLLSQPQNGALSGTAPNLIFTPNANYYGSESFTFKVNNRILDSETATVRIEVLSVNDTPVALDENGTTDEDTPVIIDILSNDYDIDGTLDKTSLLITQQPLNGTLFIDPQTAIVTYTPYLNYFGTDSIKYAIKDSAGVLSNEATVTFKVDAVNDTPIATPQHVTTPEEISKALTLSGEDSDGDTLRYTVMTSPSHGTLSGTAPNLTYTPNANYYGSDSFSFKVNDGSANSQPASVTIEVISVNDAPIAKDDTAVTDEDRPVTIDVTSNDNDIDGMLDSSSLSFSTLPLHGTVTITEGKVVYTPEANYNGTDNFTYTVKDNEGEASNKATVTITLNAVNDIPVVASQTLSMSEDGTAQITLIGEDVDGDILTFSVVSHPISGTLIGAGANFVYTPAADFVGTDSFSYQASDGTAESEVVTAEITVTAVNDAPVAYDQNLTTYNNEQIAIVLAGSDIDGDTFSYMIVTNPSNGTLTGTAPHLVYTPSPEFVGEESFSYKVSDGSLDSNTAQIRLDIIKPNNKPVGVDDNVSTSQNTPVIIDVLANDSDEDNDTLSVSSFTQPLNGTVAFSGDQIVYTPNQHFIGIDTFSYIPDDGKHDGNTAEVTVLVNTDVPSSEGKEFYFNFNIASNGFLGLYISSREDTNGTVEIEGLGFITEFEVRSGEVTVISIPEEARKESLGIESLGIHITSQHNITVYGLNGDYGSADSVLVLPTTLLGQEYVVTSYAYPDGSGGDKASQVAVTATRNNTTVHFTPKVSAVSYEGTIAAGEMLTTVLDKGEVILFTSAYDLSGSRVSSDLPVAVTSGNQCTNIPKEHGYCDHLVEMPPPLEAMGREYLTQPLAGHRLEMIRVIASSDDTTVELNGEYVKTLNNGEIYEKYTSEKLHIVTSNPSLVVQYSLAGSYYGGGDPFMMLVPPVSHHYSDYTVPAIGHKDFGRNYINVTVPTAYVDSLRFNGEEVDPSLFSPIGDASYSGASLEVTDRSNTQQITASVPFGLTVYGDGSWTSYGNPGGIFVSTLNKRPMAYIQTVQTDECTDVPVVLRAHDMDGDPLSYRIEGTAAYGSLTGSENNRTYHANDSSYHGYDSFSFVANDGEEDSYAATVTILCDFVPQVFDKNITTDEDIPVKIDLEAIDEDDDTLSYTVVSLPKHGTLKGNGSVYTYTPYANYHGTDSFTYKANDGLTDSMVAKVNIIINNINDAPVANAGNDQSVLLGESVTFHGGSSSDVDGSVVSYQWYLNDTLLYEGEGFTYTPQETGLYLLRLVVTDDLGAKSEDIVHIHVYNKSLFANAGMDQSVYAGTSITLSGNKSYALGSSLSNYQWREGNIIYCDSSSSSCTIDNLELGVHTITLTVSDSNGLTDSDEVTVTVSKDVVANAGPDSRIYLGEAARLRGNVTHTVGTDYNTYQWTEGSTTLSNAKIFDYIGTEAGVHTLTLTVTNRNGVSDSDEVKITVSPRGLMAIAGLDQIIYLGEEAQLNGSKSYSLGSGIKNYKWSEGNVTYCEGSASYSKDYCRISGLLEGEHIITLTVTDNNDLSSNDEVKVTVISPKDTNATIQANAGLDQHIYQGQSVILHGDKSYSLGSSIRYYKWTEGNTTHCNTSTSSYCIINGLNPGVHTITLSVTDVNGIKDTDDVKITVHGDTVVAQAGSDQNTYLGQTVYLNGEDSYSLESSIRYYKWSEGNVTHCSGDYRYKSCSISGLEAGIHTITLTVKDGYGFTDTDDVNITVYDKVVYADAGLDQHIYLGTTASLNGSKSYSMAGGISRYEWKEGDKTLSSNKSFTYTGLAVGEYTLTLTATDTYGNKDSDEVTVYVVNTPNDGYYVANAGEDQTVFFGEDVLLDGRFSYYADRKIDSYTWSENGEVLGSGSTLLLSSLSIGVHHIRLTTESGYWKEKRLDEVVITVLDNTLPVANAGEDQQVYLDENVTLDGTGSIDPNGEITSYLWKDGETVLSTDAVFEISALALGTHSFTLTVTDNDGNVDSDTVEITVVPAPDLIPPAANISSPIENTKVTFLTDIIGTATDENLKAYKLFISPVGVNDYTAIVESNVSVEEGVLGTLDATTVKNGLYDLLLVVVDESGNSATASTIVSIEGKAKIGNFSFTVTDFDLQVGGLPVQVNRTYSTLQRNQELDFGYGWSIDYRDVTLQENIHPGDDWTMTPDRFGIGYCFKFDRSHQVNIALPDGTTEKFEYRFEPECQGYLPNTYYESSRLKLYALNGSTAKLEVIDDTGSIMMDNTGRLYDGNTEQFDPNQYRLSLANGMVYEIRQGEGLTLVKDLREDTLTYSDNGIISTRGESLTFERDSKGRITKITDLAGKSMQYVYDHNDNLDYVIDQMGYKTDYTYQAAHLLEEYYDPSGTRLTKNIYDEAGRLTQTIDPDGNVVEFTHDIDGREEIIKDKLGRISLFVYDEDGNVLSQTNPEGETTTRTYDEKGNELTVTDPLGNTITNEFDANGNLLTATDALGYEEVTTYNSNGAPTSISDKNGNTMEIVYNVYNNPTSFTTASGALNSFTYDQFGNKASATNEYGETTTYVYDTNWIPMIGATSSKGNLLKETRPDGTVIEHTYDESSNLLSTKTTTTKADGTTVMTTVTNTYDAFNRLVSTTDELGNTTTYVYDARGNKVSTTDAQDRVTKYSYTPSNKLTKTEYPDGTTEAKSYDAMDNLLSETNAEGETTSYEYDGADRLTKTTYPDGTYTSTEYDDAGRVISTTDENGNTTSYEYDAVSNRISITDALDNKTTYTYDSQGNMLSMTDALNQTTTYEYNALNQRVKTIYPDGTTLQEPKNTSGLPSSKIDENGNVTTYGYDTSRTVPLLNQVTLQNGAVTSYGHDSEGKKTSQSDAEGRTTSWSYTDKGQLSTETLPMGESKTFTYDSYGKQTQINDYANKAIKFIYDSNDKLVRIEYADGSTVTYDYTPSGRIKTITDTQGTITNTYDNRGRLKSQTNPSGETITYSYDGVGNITEIVTPTQTISKTYDKLNCLSSVTDTKGTISYTYDAIGRQTKITYPNGVTTNYNYDTRNRVTKIEHTDSNGNILQSFAYTLDNVGNRTKIVEHTGRTTDYVYNSVNQLTKETVTNDPNGQNTVTTYSYDLVGNLKTKTIDGVQTNYTYNDNDQLTQQGPSTFTYDANGNLIQKDDTTYTYDDQNRLIKVQTPTNAIEYSYDANNNRIVKTTTAGTTTYLVDTNTPYAQVITESKADGTEIQYIYGNDLISNGDSYFLTDALGSTRGLIDETETLTDTYSYTPYGELKDHTGSSENNFLYTGEQFDPETEDYYLRARYYSPRNARFTSIDPFEGRMFEPITLNDYIYAGDNPVIYVDPDGRMFIGVSMVSFTFTPVRSLNTVSSAQRYGPYVYRATNIALKSSTRSVKQLRALRKSKPNWFKSVNGDRLEIHHVLEKRFWENAYDPRIKAMFNHKDDIPGAVLTKARHNEITNRWVKALGKKGMKDFDGYENITLEKIYNAVGTVYRDDPLQKQAIMRKILEFMF